VAESQGSPGGTPQSKAAGEKYVWTVEGHDLVPSDIGV
jgi:hypothetical protein